MPDLANELWSLANVTTGFAAAQTFLFVHACSREAFKVEVAKIAPALWWGFPISGFAYVGIVYWSASRCCVLDPGHGWIYTDAAIGRIAILLVLGCFAIYMLRRAVKAVAERDADPAD